MKKHEFGNEKKYEVLKEKFQMELNAFSSDLRRSYQVNSRLKNLSEKGFKLLGP